MEWFRRTHSESTDRTLNLLLLPWPLEVLPSDFKKAAAPNHLSLAEGFGFFDFDPSKRPPVDKIGQIVDAAQAQVGDIHGIILPESALSERDFREAKRLLSSHSPQVGFFLSGVRKPDTNCALMTVFEPQDAAATESEDRGQDFEQHKHHRWYLDDDQIRQYHLGGSLHPDTRWWESMKVRSRRLHFLSYYDWLVMVPLVCEDLARPDPVADIVRAVGPNLVIALLLDGPQLAQRWSGRYASILADDPGSSVLSLTSLGMVTRSNPPGTSPSRVVALWRDPRNGHREISLDRGSDGVVVMLSGMQDDEWTADGRKDSGTANCLVLSGVEQVAAP